MSRTFFVCLGLGFGVALAIIVGEKMTTDAMAVVIGVAVGVTASIPTSLLLVALLRRERGAYRGEAMERPQLPPGGFPDYGQFPPNNVIVLDPMALAAQAQRSNPYPKMQYQPFYPSAERPVQIIGDGDESDNA